ncbi:MAG: helix-turn-helix domain-containing protein [Lactobacillus sp.]|uniref:Helix-turn-helix domain-containing protein n=1 Tax=Lacticaseibacillus suilingensis TaxID=2799577 RepID=A0ABW4BDJ0_9LACO|nr:MULTISPECIES: helix-turn-helix domain-containing protein [Lacticaseibacillus]MCI1942381.1 helix-turn-helix domain-containing protein [Lactobacillus sp.]MCI1972966.1 helix-turn-helix domain-containing protein [Lactobacillus sp.]MCI2017395.1 helix-turn-helix domain-containing protein [Lactobacillus sp.]MCI2037420.1 helix-turn-helix domain-containing protein [Lactobacillus sp.]
MAMVELKRYTVVNEYGEYLEDDDLLLLPGWTKDLKKTWITYSQVEAQRVAHQAEGVACELKAIPLEQAAAPQPHRGVPIAVQKQVITLWQQGMSYRKIASLLKISKSSVGNIVNKD